MKNKPNRNQKGVMDAENSTFIILHSAFLELQKEVTDEL
jgi:hypothetical protein